MSATGFTSAPLLEPMKSAPSPASSQVRPTKCCVSRRGQFGDLVQPGIARVETGAAALLQGQAGLLRAVEHRRGVIADIVAGAVGPVRIEQRLPGHGQGRGSSLRLRVRQQGAVELDAQLAGIVVTHGIAHGDHGRHATLEQRVGRAGVAGALVQRDVFCFRDRSVLRARLLALGHGEEVIPVLHTQDVAGVAGAEEEEARDEATGPDEEIEQVLPGEVVLGAAGFGEFEEVQVPVPAPVHDVVAAIFLDLRLQPLARDAVREEVGDDAALRIDFLFKEPAQDPPLQSRRQRARPPRLGEDEQHAQALVPAERERLRGRRRHVMDDADEEVALAQRGLVRRRPRHLPRHAGERRRKVIVRLGGAG